MTGHDHDRHVRSCADDAFAKVEAAHLGHSEIGEHGIELLTCHPPERLRRRGQCDDLVSLAFERELQELTHTFIIVDDEDCSSHVHVSRRYGRIKMRLRSTVRYRKVVFCRFGHVFLSSRW